ncbi:xylose isomerase-like enzyme [Microvirga lotononidis]|uniref:Xylose isomerase-like enzyme n=1 Tax=Microvirga lotononidis TaxID=864069 RepID=I4Z3C0_9HYPH|nr:xylose isomerase-like enzyme [Microvirga lotononidis]
MKIALDPYMHRPVPLLELPQFVAEPGYEYIELSLRVDFLDWWVNPRVSPERIRDFKKALRDSGVKLASLLPMYRWASPHQVERLAAMRYWKNAIRIAVELECDTMNSEFGRGPAPSSPFTSYNCCAGGHTEICEAAFWDSMDELVPIFERGGIQLNIEPHPEDFVETLQPAVDMIRSINGLERHGGDPRSGGRGPLRHATSAAKSLIRATRRLKGAGEEHPGQALRGFHNLHAAGSGR